MYPDNRDDSSALAPNDPYKKMDRRDTRPDFLAARSNLSKSEQSAAAAPDAIMDGGTNRAKSAEQNQAYSPRFSGKGLPEITDEKRKSKGFFKRKGPLLAILTLLIGGGGLMAGSQMLMPFATANRIIQEFNSMKTVMSKRSDRILRYQMDTERYKNPTRVTIFGNEKFKLSNKQIGKLKTEGIDVMEVDVNGQKVRLLAFDDGSGTKQSILTNTDMGKIDADALNASLKNAAPDAVFKTSAINIDSAFEIDGFRNGYLVSSKTWKGNIAGWFDSLVIKVFGRLGIDRNRFKKWKTAGDIEAGNAEFKKIAQNQRQFDDDGTSGTKRDVEEVQQDDGSFEEQEVDKNLETGGLSSDDSVSGKKSLAEIHSALESKVVKSAQAASTLICAAFAAVGAVHAIVAAQQASELLNLVTGYLEAVQKVQAGDGDGSPMAYYTNALTSPGENGKSGMEAQGIGALFGSGGINTKDASVQATNSESLLPKIELLGAEIQYTADAFLNCAYAKAGAAAVGLIVDVIGAFTFGIASLFKGLVKSIGMGVIMGTLLPLLAKSIIPFAAEMIMKNYITEFVGEDLGNAITSGANKYLGGNHQGGGGSPGDQKTVLAYRRETERILAEEAEYDRQNRSPFDVTSQNTFLGSLLYRILPVTSSFSSVTAVVSGVSSIVGSSLTSLLPTAGAIAETNLITTQGDCPLLESVNIMGDAYCNPYYTSDMSTISADPGEDIYEYTANAHLANYPKVYSPLQEDEELCRRTDAFGNYYWSYKYPTNFKYIEGNADAPEKCVLDVKLDANDNPVINANSALGRYIIFCGQRSSPWGIADGNIASQAVTLDIDTGNGSLDGVLNGVIGAIPFIGDAQQALEAADEAENVSWVSGGACVASSENTNWEENKYYQRYAEDQRLLEASGMIEKSSVTAMLDEYYGANPLDDSYEGYIARMAGMTKEQVISTLDAVESLIFLAQYDPANLYPVPAEPDPEVNVAEHFADVPYATGNSSPVPHYVVYADTRNRNYAV